MESEILEKLVKRVDKAEKEVKFLTEELQTLKESKTEEIIPEELLELEKQNAKLKYRKSILEQSVQELESSNLSDPNNITSVLTSLFSSALNEIYPDLPVVEYPVTPSSKFADYQFNGAMSVAGRLKKNGIKTSPKEVAENILKNLKKSELISSVDVAGPGFINIHLNKSWLSSKLADVIRYGVKPPPKSRKLKVIVDYSSPNIAKEMHVGHLRSTIIGESTCRFLEFLGHEVLRLNHVGDWGTQFGMLIAHLRDKFPNYGKQTPSIGDLMAFYKESKTRFDEDESFKSRAYDCVVKLQSKNPEYIKAWDSICKVSRDNFQIIYDRLGISGLIERGESFYQDLMIDVVNELTAKCFLEEDEGRKIMFAPGAEIPLTVIKTGGGFTYDTSDMAAIKHRILKEKGDWLIYVTDNGQSTHFNSIFSCAKRVGWYDPVKVRIDHVGFGVVLGEDKKKFKTRSGDTVRLAELLDEGIKRSRTKLEENKRNDSMTQDELTKISESVAYGCIKYADLSHNRTHDYVFSFDRMLEDKGNTAVYMLYAYTRIQSIARNASITQKDVQAALDNTEIKLEHEKEIKLAKLLLRFPEIISKIIDDLYLHSICEFMFEVATTFTEFYDSCYCVEKNSEGKIININMERILICDATAKILDKCFYILGIQPLSKM